MANNEPMTNLDDRHGGAASGLGFGPDAPSIDEIWRLAESLGPDDRLRLVARLWKTLPRDHRAALATLQAEPGPSRRNESFASKEREIIDSPLGPTASDLMDRIFNRERTSELYSAPRRFDLASIFVVTAAYSLLLGALSLLGSPPLLMVVIAGMIGIIAATQAMYQQVANPRGVSIITGAVAFALICVILHFTTRGILSRSLFVNVIIIGIPGGAILGYLIGTVVGGVFLVADMVRKKFDARSTTPASDDAMPPDGTQVSTEETASTSEVATS